MRLNTRLSMLFAAVMTLTACASGPAPMQIRADVDALASEEAKQKQRYVILPGNKDINEQDLQFIEFKNYLEKALASRGFIKAASLQEGNVVIFLSYGIGTPETHHYSYEVPVWGDVGYYYPYSRRSRFYSGFGYMPMQGITGYAQRVESYTAYTRYALLDAYDMGPYLQQQKLVQLWKTRVESKGTSNDLRLTFPYMVTAMQPYIGTNTEHMVATEVDEFNPLLRDLLGISSPPQTPSK